jgi:hypothetical protein
VQRGVAGASRVHVGAMFDEQRRELAVAAVRGDDQRARAVGRDVGRLRAGAQQDAAGFQVALTRGEQERREAAEINRRHPAALVAIAEPVAGVHNARPHLGARLNVGAGLDERANDRGVSVRHGPHQGGLPVRELLRADVGAAADERLDHRHVAGARRGHQRRLAAGQLDVRVGARANQDFDHRRAAVLACQCQRRDP